MFISNCILQSLQLCMQGEDADAEEKLKESRWKGRLAPGTSVAKFQRHVYFRVRLCPHLVSKSIKDEDKHIPLISSEGYTAILGLS